jgi:hypothetical protein
MKKTYLSLFFILSALATSATVSTSASANTADLCVEPAADAIVQYLQAQEPGSKIAIVRDSQGALVGLTDENGIYNELEFSDVFKDEPNSHIYEFRDGDYIVFATVTILAPNGSLACTVTDVDSGQDDQD